MRMFILLKGKRRRFERNSLSYNSIPTISCDVVKTATSPCIADTTFHFLGAKLRKKSQRQKDFPIYLFIIR